MSDEEKILDMSGIFFEEIIKEIGYKLNYEAIANYAGNSFFENSWETISKNNPLYIKSEQEAKNTEENVGNILGKGEIKIMSSPLNAQGIDEETRKILSSMMNKYKDTNEEDRSKV